MEEDNKQEPKKQQSKQTLLPILDGRLDQLLQSFEEEPILVSLHVRWIKEGKKKPRRVFSIIQCTKIGSNVDLLKQINPLTG